MANILICCICPNTHIRVLVHYELTWQTVLFDASKLNKIDHTTAKKNPNNGNPIAIFPNTEIDT